MILYQGRPTTTIAVGDPLTFRLEAQDGYNYVTDIFATNVVARDPYSGRSVQLIDRYGYIKKNRLNQQSDLIKIVFFFFLYQMSCGQLHISRT